MRQNLGWAIGYNTLALPIGAGVFTPTLGLVLRPELAALSMAGALPGSVSRRVLSKSKQSPHLAPAQSTTQIKDGVDHEQ